MGCRSPRSVLGRSVRGGQQPPGLFSEVLRCALEFKVDCGKMLIQCELPRVGALNQVPRYPGARRPHPLPPLPCTESSETESELPAMKCILIHHMWLPSLYNNFTERSRCSSNSISSFHISVYGIYRTSANVKRKIKSFTVILRKVLFF